MTGFLDPGTQSSGGPFFWWFLTWNWGSSESRGVGVGNIFVAHSRGYLMVCFSGQVGGHTKKLDQVLFAGLLTQNYRFLQ